jgi:hypothetical protein
VILWERSCTRTPVLPHYDTISCDTVFTYEKHWLADLMYLIAIGWMYVVLMMAVAEATASNGTVLGAVITFVLYGVMPLSIVLYLVATPRRRALRKRAEVAGLATAVPPGEIDTQSRNSTDPDGSGHAPGDSVATKREKA